jgi:hypothetical protein
MGCFSARGTTALPQTQDTARRIAAKKLRRMRAWRKKITLRDSK